MRTRNQKIGGEDQLREGIGGIPDSAVPFRTQTARTRSGRIQGGAWAGGRFFFQPGSLALGFPGGIVKQFRPGLGSEA